MKFNKWTLGLMAALACTGCSTSWIESNGIKASNTRWFWSSTDFKASMSTNGTMNVELKSSNTDSAAIQAAAEGVAKGIVAGMTKP